MILHRVMKRSRASVGYCAGALALAVRMEREAMLAGCQGKSLPGDQKPDGFWGQIGLLKKNVWDFKQRGQSGLRPERFCQLQLNLLRGLGL
ncbi:MAG: hypothetical protein M2R45_04327 [Verrucomicrobia subdivision 3 bacterium]|nr:hypothetical protein [Limisphaerales bacterium]MCS1417243.1 hypothetical protein [Limisphaerales bacterium]